MSSMGRPWQGVDQQGIVPSDDAELLLNACPDLDEWPLRWQCEAADLVPGTAIVATFKPLLLDLLRRQASKTTFNRDRRNLWLVGGEIIRFAVNGKSFSWSFSGPLTVTSFNLRRIAPPDRKHRGTCEAARCCAAASPNFRLAADGGFRADCCVSSKRRDVP